MPIRSIAQLKAWFRRGKYPTEEQFADWMDSYVHKDEDTVPMSKVDGLIGQLNGKYAKTAGEELERQHNELKSDYDAHKRSSDEQFSNIAENIEELEAEDERLDGCIKEETRRATGVEGQLQAAITAEQSRAEGQEDAIRKEFAAADEKEMARATAEETKLDGKITAETERATGVEGQLQTAITAEQSRAEAQEAAIRQEFAAADKVIDDALKAEAARAKKAEQDETARATDEETRIRTEFAAADATRLKEAKEYTDTKVANIVDSAPETLDTLKELSRALNDDPDFAATVARQMGGKADRTELPGAITEQEIETIFNQ